MNRQICAAVLTIHVTLEPPAGERVLHLRPGDEVDFDEVVRPARPGRDAMTLGEALDGRHDCFEIPGHQVEDDPTAPRLDPTTGLDLDHAITMTADAGAELPVKE